MERVAEAYVVANLCPGISIGTVVETCSSTVNRQVEIHPQVNLGARNRGAGLLAVALFISAVHHHLVTSAIFSESHKALVILQRHKTCNIAILHAGAIHKCAARALGAKGTHRKRILCILHTSIGTACSNAVMSRICRQAPVLVVGIMVKLPFQRKLIGIKIVRGHHAITR